MSINKTSLKKCRNPLLCEDGKNPKWHQCYKMYQELSLSEKTLEKVFSQIAQLLRANFSDEWSNFTLLMKTGVEMPELMSDNTDLTEDSYEHTPQWKKTYLV